MNAREKCQTCWYSRTTSNGLECHRQPPLPKSEHTQSGWPAVGHHDWCGEYRWQGGDQ